ncbi:SPOR domain-containing protein [Mesorhizobium sp. B1-1-8]|uniref:SPOR domain-containing protein n=1 Tax=Mesorhizobium sp. B1-1-8 TaxID=2589976 RepID=UPI001127E2AB|nr:SPOR domain-containing protein [Mesorhizobium sp. B1-1-8]UCI05095.1 SPOR domain-containing protein [Mesorhizobium sp. B1-1-8]
MADRTQLKVADHNDIAADDPFAELTRIMGFDPRQPVRPQAPAVEKAAPANQVADEADFDIDLEKELMGEFGAADDSALAAFEPARQEPAFETVRQEPASETVSAPASEDEFAASFEQDFIFDDAADHADSHFAPVRAPEPAADIAFDDDFDKAVAGSLDVSPLEDDFSIDDEMAASLDEGFRLDRHVPELDQHVGGNADDAVGAAPVTEAAFDADFDNAVQMSLEDELAFDDHMPEQPPEVAEARPAEVHAAAEQQTLDEDFAGHFDEALADVDMDLSQHQDLSPEDLPQEDLPREDLALQGNLARQEDLTVEEDFVGEDNVGQEPELPSDDEQAPVVEAPAEAAHFAAEPDADPEPVTGQAFEDDFELDFSQALSEEPEVRVAAAAAEAQPSFTAPAVPAFTAPAAPAPVPPVAAVEPAKPAASERSLEDELNALLGAMTARPIAAAREVAAPVAREAVAPVAREVVATPQPVAQPASYGQKVEQKIEPADNLDWDLDEDNQARNEQAAEDADLDALLAGELDRQDFGAAHGTESAEPSIDFDDEAFDAAFAKGIEADQHAPVATAADVPARSPVNSADWRQSVPAEPVRSSWSRVTPVAAPSQASFAVQPAASAPQMSAPAYRDEPANDYSAYAKPAQAPQPRRYDDVPEVETVDVPERVVALADDLDIPELNFEEDQPAAPAYDDLDAEFAGLLNDMNATEIAPAPVQGRGYSDDSYNTGFKVGYDRRELRAETPAAPAAASYAMAANDFDVDNLPGNQPVSQADDFAVDELDYDPELDEAMTVPGLAEHEAAKPRRRGLMIAALVGAVVIAGGLGALAFSFGGKGGSAAPVIVKADNAPIKVKPENPGGTVVPNQDNKVYDAVAKGTKPAEPVQQKLVTNTEEPVDLASKEPPQSRVVDLSPDDTDTAPGTDAAGNPDAAAPGSTQAAAPESAQPAAPAPKSEDRIAQVLQEADKATNTDVVAVAPRKVKTMMVKPDGSLVPREDPAPAAAPAVAAAEPADPAPQHVASAAQPVAAQTGTVTEATDQPADQADAGQSETAKPTPAAKPAAAPKPAAAQKVEAKVQSASTPAMVPVAPQRPSDQPVDVVGEVKPDQVASIDPAAAGGGSWSMQIASQPTVESAQSTYQDLQRRYGSVLSGRTASIVKAEIAGKGTFYRVRVPAQSRNDAINLCTSYKAAGGNCFVSR